MKPRHHLYLDEELSARLDLLASRPGTSKSAIISDALREYLNRRATREVDDLLKHRLDRISKQLGRIERDGCVLSVGRGGDGSYQSEKENTHGSDVRAALRRTLCKSLLRFAPPA